MSRYELEDGRFRELVVGCDEGLGALFLHGSPRPGRANKVWYPRLESIRELELVLRHHEMRAPPAMLRQLEAELFDRTPYIEPGDRVFWRAGPTGDRSRTYLVLNNFLSQELLLLLLDGDEERWVPQQETELDLYAKVTPEDAERVARALAPSDPSEADFEEDENDPFEIEAELTAAVRDEDAALLRKLLATGGLFER